MHGNICGARVTSDGAGPLSFLLDPFALLLIGFLAGKLYYLAVAFGDRVFSRGVLRRELIAAGAMVVALFWAYSALLYLGVIYFPWPLPHWYGGTDWMLNSGLPLGLSRSATTDVAAVVIFATYPAWYYLGTELGRSGLRVTPAQRMKERAKILRALSEAEFPRGGAIPASANDVDASASVEDLLQEIPPLFDDAITTLLFVFDSRFFVLAFTGRWKRFVELDPEEKEQYMEVWKSNIFLLSVAQILRFTCSYGYYTKAQVYSTFGYNGPMVPELPPWYRPGPTVPGRTDPSGGSG
ncbi:MAG: hypothetical protein OK456_03575 [Thaumarchaeota archaeon]|nr:hypothetical protein [Nitrososphaerota archaeon]